MRLATITVTSIVCGLFLITAGCDSAQIRDLKLQNQTQQRRIAQLESEVQAANLQLDQLKRQLEAMGGRSGIEMSALQQKIAALEEELSKKKALIEAMQKQLLGATQLPAELTSMLEEWAKGSDLVSFDAARGIVKFKSDLLFEKGSDEVAPGAAEAVKALCKILNTDQAKEFDIIIAGHTDDLPILKPETKAKHPTNWYLSAHRAISVSDVMTANGIVPERVSVRGFGEFRPIVPNELGRKGNPQNRRVEIYIVPKGT
ncbi:MAG: OmpA family protein [Sedimentisphaerales bacterium]|nr:OmpA family protein [Sedimentisphaerales bacterium]